MSAPIATRTWSRARRGHRVARLLGTLLAAAAVCPAAPWGGAALASARLSPPVIHEVFTPMPCPAHPSTTLDFEGCDEQRILRTDRQIDLVARSIFSDLYDDAARRRFIAAQDAWLAYRAADCTSMSDQYEGGTLAGVVAASCTADRSAQRLADLRSFEKALTHP